MNPNIFMSYSRREVPFVNYLVDDLEDQGFNVWLDYRSLIPGTPWAEQIDKGIAESEVILLVVSRWDQMAGWAVFYSSWELKSQIFYLRLIMAQSLRSWKSQEHC